MSVASEDYCAVSYCKWNNPKKNPGCDGYIGCWVGGASQAEFKEASIKRPKTQGALTKMWTSYKPHSLLNMEIFFCWQGCVFCEREFQGQNTILMNLSSKLRWNSMNPNHLTVNSRTGTAMLQCTGFRLLDLRPQFT